MSPKGEREIGGENLLRAHNQEKYSLKETDQKMVIVCIQGLEPRSTFIFCFRYRCSCGLICRFLCCDAGLLLPSNCNSRLKTSQFQREWYLGFGVHQLGNGYRVLYLVLSEYRYMRKPFFFQEKTILTGILHVLVLFLGKQTVY